MEKLDQELRFILGPGPNYMSSHSKGNTDNNTIEIPTIV